MEHLHQGYDSLMTIPSSRRRRIVEKFIADKKEEQRKMESQASQARARAKRR